MHLSCIFLFPSFKIEQKMCAKCEINLFDIEFRKSMNLKKASKVWNCENSTFPFRVKTFHSACVKKTDLIEKRDVTLHFLEWKNFWYHGYVARVGCLLDYYTDSVDSTFDEMDIS